MTKINKINDNIVLFAGVFAVNNFFDKTLRPIIDNNLGQRGIRSEYKYSDNFSAIISNFMCGGKFVEDIQNYLKEYLSSKPGRLNSI